VPVGRLEVAGFGFVDFLNRALLTRVGAFRRVIEKAVGVKLGYWLPHFRVSRSLMPQISIS